MDDHVVLDLDAIDAREKAATRGPWRWDADRCVVISDGGSDYESAVVVGACPEDGPHIAHSRADILALVAEVRRLRLVEQLVDGHERAAVASAEEARLWRALAKARSTNGIPLLEAGSELRRRQVAADAAVDALRAAGIDPDAPEGT